MNKAIKTKSSNTHHVVKGMQFPGPTIVARAACAGTWYTQADVDKAVPAEDVPVAVRCQRHGCMERWPKGTPVAD